MPIIFILIYYLHTFILLLSRLGVIIVIIQVDHWLFITFGDFQVGGYAWAFHLNLLDWFDLVLRQVLVLWIFVFLDADDHFHLVYILDRNLVKVWSTCKIMVSSKVDPCMEAIEFKLNICQKVLVGQLIVLKIFVLYTVSFYLLLSH